MQEGHEWCGLTPGLGGWLAAAAAGPQDAHQTLGMEPGKAARMETDNAAVEPPEVEAEGVGHLAISSAP